MSRKQVSTPGIQQRWSAAPIGACSNTIYNVYDVALSTFSAIASRSTEDLFSRNDSPQGGIQDQACFPSDCTSATVARVMQPLQLGDQCIMRRAECFQPRRPYNGIHVRMVCRHGAIHVMRKRSETTAQYYQSMTDNQKEPQAKRQKLPERDVQSMGWLTESTMQPRKHRFVEGSRLCLEEAYTRDSTA